MENSRVTNQSSVKRTLTFPALSHPVLDPFPPTGCLCCMCCPHVTSPPCLCSETLYFIKTSRQVREVTQPVTCLSHKCEDLGLILPIHVENPVQWHSLVIPALGRQSQMDPSDKQASQFSCLSSRQETPLNNQDGGFLRLPQAVPACT